MRTFPRIILTGIVFFAYVVGGMIIPIAHTHSGGSCCSDVDCCLNFEENVATSSSATSSTTVRCTAPDCPFEHSQSDKKTTRDHSESPHPSTPHENCAACQLLYMAADAVPFVVLIDAEEPVVVPVPASAAAATFADIAFQCLRGPPAC